MLDVMGANTCAALAQIMPVFLIALIAERIRVKRSPVKQLETAALILRTVLGLLRVEVTPDVW